MKPLKTQAVIFFLVAVVLINRCTCDVNVKPKDPTSGNADLVIDGLNAFANPSGAQYISVTFTGNVGQTSDGTGTPSLTVSQKFEIDPSGNINPGTTLSRVNLQPGTWTVSVQINNWTTSCTGEIVKGKKTTFRFAYNVSGCIIP